MLRARLRLSSTHVEKFHAERPEAHTVRFSVVHSDDKKFAQGGGVNMSVSKEVFDKLEIGKEYDLNLTNKEPE